MDIEYYEGQLNRLKGNAGHIKICLRDDDAKTNWLTLNTSSIPLLIEFLQFELANICANADCHNQNKQGA